LLIPAFAAGIADVADDPKEGQPADIPVLEVQMGRCRLTGVAGVSRTGRRAIPCRS
jgi:hypothetical protein